MRKILLGTVLIGGSLALAGASSPASASLIFLGNSPGSVPGGVGNSGIVLSLQSPNNTTIETGAVTPGPTCSGDTQPPCGSPSNGTPTLASAGVTTAASLRIFLDAAEPGNDNAVKVNSLTLSVYNSAGTTLEFSAPLDTTMLPAGGIVTTCPGQGNNCVNIFGLNATEAAALQATPGFSTSWIAALSASLGDALGGPGGATGGPDRFFLGNANSPPTNAPEPASLALLGVGLVGLGLSRVRRFKH